MKERAKQPRDSQQTTEGSSRRLQKLRDKRPTAPAMSTREESETGHSNEMSSSGETGVRDDATVPEVFVCRSRVLPR